MGDKVSPVSRGSMPLYHCGCAFGSAPTVTETVPRRREKAFHGSWGAYFKAELGGSRSRAYELLDAGRVARVLQSGIPDSRIANGRVAAALQSTGVDRPVSRVQARELTPLLDAGRVMRRLRSRLGRERSPVQGGASFDDRGERACGIRRVQEAVQR